MGKLLGGIFWKLFVVIWLAILLNVLVTIPVFLYLTMEQNMVKAHRMIEPLFSRLASSAEEAYRQGGRAGLRQWARGFSVGSRDQVSVRIVDAEGRDILDRALSRRAEELLAAYRRRQLMMGHVRPVAESYLLVVNPPHILPMPPLALLVLPEWVKLALIVLLLLVSWCICSLAAYYLSSRLRRLLCAVRAFGEGELSTRVGRLRGRPSDELGELLAVGIARRNAGPDGEIQFARVEYELESLNTLTDELLTFARLDARVRELIRQPLELRSLIERIAADARLEAQAHGCALSIQCRQPVHLEADKTLLQRAIENIVRNAIRYTRPGTEVTLCVKVLNASPTDKVFIQVSDRGPAVPADQLKKIFAPFYRVDASRDMRESAGTGIGLAIAERAVRLHGGDVQARRREGGGLVVEIVLPLDCRDTVFS